MITNWSPIIGTQPPPTLDRDGESCAVFGQGHQYRYLLSRPVPRLLHGPRIGSLLVCALNPSKAGASDDDQTVKKLRVFAKRLGASELIVVNLFAYISTKSKGLHTPRDPVGPLNDLVIREAVTSLQPNSRTVVAWGSHTMVTTGRVAHVMRLLPKELWCWGVTRNGDPRHPSRIAYETPLVRWHWGLVDEAGGVRQ